MNTPHVNNTTNVAMNAPWKISYTGVYQSRTIGKIPKPIKEDTHHIAATAGDH